MIDVLQVWPAVPSFPVSPIVVAVGTLIVILVLDAALSLLGRDRPDLVIEGTTPSNPFIVSGEGAPESARDSWEPATHEPEFQPYCRDVVAMAMFAVGTTPRGVVARDARQGGVATAVKVSVPYGRDFTRAMKIVSKACREYGGVVEEPASTVRIAGLADSAIELVAVVWSSRPHSEAFTDGLVRAIADELSVAGFDVPVETA